jgi:lysophospholipid acyltransferase (LPLAT)-like uncharacterized protein
MKRGVLYRCSIRVVPLVISVLLRGWFATCRINEHGTEHRRKAEQAKCAVALFWHYSLVYVFYHLRKDRAAVLVSASEDGEYIARLARCLNFETVRGSSNRRGMLALKELLHCLDNGSHVGMVGDGSQGPPLVVQAGSILLASKSGAPVLPIAWSASRSFTFKSWDRTCIPTLFSRIDFFYGKPIDIPGGLDRDGIERYRIEVDRALNELYRTAWRYHGRDTHHDD